MVCSAVPDDDQSLIEVVPGDSPVAAESLDEMVGWQSYFIRHFVQKAGQHLLEIGKTGTGKTQFLYWIVDLLREYSPKEAIVWFDIGKGEEILALIEFFGRRRGEPITICTLPGCEVEIEYEDDADITFVTVAHCREVWQHIKPGRILIACFEPFIEDPVLAVKETADMFSELSHLAHMRQIYAPTAIIYDEFHNVCPSQGYGYAISGKESRIQSQSISLIRRNVQKLRSQGLRVIATTHQWTQMNRGVRASFEWIVPRRGTLFSSDDERLRAFNPLWRKMKTNECYIVLPDGQFSSSLRLPFYADGQKLGKIWYGGIYESISEKQE